MYDYFFVNNSIFSYCQSLHSLTNIDFAGNNRTYGGMPERLNGTVSKTVVGLRPPRVRIPVPPPSPSPVTSTQVHHAPNQHG